MVFVTLGFLLWIGCGGSETSETTASSEGTTVAEDTTGGAKASKKHLDIKQVTPLFPSTLITYAFDSVKKKTKSADWIELSATYKLGDRKLKVVINDYLPNGNPEWKTLFDSLPEQSTNGYQAAFHQKKDKSTWMVLVGDRFRVDFKSTTDNQESLQRMASAFDYKALVAMSK